MADSLLQSLTWLREHETIAYLLAVVLVYICWNVSKRPPPSNPVLLVLWRLAETITFLPWDQWFGRPVLPGGVSPPLPPREPVVPDPPAPPPAGPIPPESFIRRNDDPKKPPPFPPS